MSRSIFTPSMMLPAVAFLVDKIFFGDDFYSCAGCAFAIIRCSNGYLPPEPTCSLASFVRNGNQQGRRSLSFRFADVSDRQATMTAAGRCAQRGPHHAAIRTAD
jgi:hypothetical protein